MDKLNEFLTETTEALRTKQGVEDWLSKHGYYSKYGYGCVECGSTIAPDWIAFETSAGLVCVDCDYREDELWAMMGTQIY